MHGQEFNGLQIPLGALIHFKPNETKSDSLDKMEPQTIAGVFIGYGMAPGMQWNGEYLAFAAVALCARDNFQISIALIGGISGAPIAFICPATFHLRTVPQSALGVVADVVCILLGLAAMLCVTWQAVAAFVVANAPQR